jgi:hypothetical protein
MSRERRGPGEARNAEIRADSGSGRSSRPEGRGRDPDGDRSRVERSGRSRPSEHRRDDGGRLDARVAPQAAESGPAHQG